MAEEPNLVKVGCTLPHGPTMELGKPGEKTYRYFALKRGTNMVPAEFAKKWFRDNANLRHVKDRSIYLMK